MCNNKGYHTVCFQELIEKGCKDTQFYSGLYLARTDFLELYCHYLIVRWLGNAFWYEYKATLMPARLSSREVTEWLYEFQASDDYEPLSEYKGIQSETIWGGFVLVPQ